MIQSPQDLSREMFSCCEGYLSAKGTEEVTKAVNRHTHKDTRPLGAAPRVSRWQRRVWQWLHREAAPLQAISVLIGMIAIVVSVTSESTSRSARDESARKQAHYVAWQLINSAHGQTGSGGRVEALQDLNRDHVTLGFLNVEGANLVGIDLPDAILPFANLRDAFLGSANLRRAMLYEANLEHAYLGGAKLEDAYLARSNLTNALLYQANLRNADLQGANLRGADLELAILDGAWLTLADLRGVPVSVDGNGLTVDQLKRANQWDLAFYDDNTRTLLNLTPAVPYPTPTPWGTPGPLRP